MFLPLDPSSGLPIFRQIMEQVRRMLAAGTLRPGERLDSVRELAGRLQVNPLTVGKAYQQLEREGLIEMRRGLGMFVTARSGDDRAQQQAVERTAQRLAVEALQAGLTPRQTHALLTVALAALDATPVRHKETQHGR